jgi:hypothetical protein
LFKKPSLKILIASTKPLHTGFSALGFRRNIKALCSYIANPYLEENIFAPGHNSVLTQ